MKQKIFIFLVTLTLLISQAMADGSVKPLNQGTYYFQVQSSPIALVAWMNKSGIDDYHVRLREHLRDLTEFYQFDPMVKFYSVDVLREPILTHTEGIKTTPTIEVFRFGEKVGTLKGFMQLDDLILLIDKARE
jgi:hypothetical protein